MLSSFQCTNVSFTQGHDRDYKNKHWVQGYYIHKYFGYDHLSRILFNLSSFAEKIVK